MDDHTYYPVANDIETMEEMNMVGEDAEESDLPAWPVIDNEDKVEK